MLDHLNIIWDIILSFEFLVYLNSSQFIMKISLKKVIVLFSISVFIFLVFSYVCGNRTIRLIVRGDDMGYCHAANLGCIKSYKQGIMTAVEVMVPCAFFPEEVATSIMMQHTGTLSQRFSQAKK